MKKYVVGLVAGTMILSLVACLPTGVTNAGDKDSNDAVATIVSDSNSGSNTDNGNNGNDVDQNNIDNPGDNGDSDNTGSKPAYTSYPIYLVYDYTVDNKYADETDYNSIKIIDTAYSNIYVTTAEYNNFDYAELSEKIQQVNKDNEKALKDVFDGFAKDFDEMFADVELNWGPVLYEYDHKGIIRADQKIFSTGNNVEVYYGGAHGGNLVGGFCYDSQTGEEITFNDVFVKTEGLADIITDKLYENYDKEIFFKETEEELKEDVQMYVDQLIDGTATNWTVNYDGVGIYFGDYALAAYASGHQIVYINYDEYPDYLNPKYFEDADSEYVMQVSKNIYYPMNLGDKEYALNFYWEKEWNEQGQFYSDTYQHVLVYGSPDFYQDIDIDGSFIDPNIYIIRKGGKDYLYIQNHYFDGVDFLQIFEFDGEKFVEIAAYQGGISFETNELTDSNFWANTSFANSFEFPCALVMVDDDGCLIREGDFRYELYEGWEENYSYVALSDMKGYEVDDYFMPAGGEKTLKKDTKVRPLQTDLETYIVLIDTDGEKYAFDIKDKDGEMTINGKLTGQLFDINNNW